MFMLYTSRYRFTRAAAAACSFGMWSLDYYYYYYNLPCTDAPFDQFADIY